ncbi:MAG TPA: hypothetical protein VKA07_04130 [Candidatus Sulfotelmatobacter sp.]|nr:hypothetical protein [Candidatus Sulfotelmatobacter sp.]
MPARAHKHAAIVEPAAASAVAALEHDPFYRAICAGPADDAIRRRSVHLSDRRRLVRTMF